MQCLLLGTLALCRTLLTTVQHRQQRRVEGRSSLESSRVESTWPQSKIQSSTTLRCCDPLPALLPGAAGVVCPTAGSRTGRALSRAPPLDPYALKAVGILSVPDTTPPAFLNC